jgi:hypothetical protein
MLIVSALFSLLITSPLSADSGPHIATRMLPWPCGESRATALKYFGERDITIDDSIIKTDLKDLIGESECANCFGLFFCRRCQYGPHSLDSHGKPIRSTFSGLWKYTRARLQPRIYSDLDAYGVMVLRDAADGCLASLMFRFTAVKWPFVPIIDGESAEFESNGRLEAEYLDAISKISK